MLNADLCGFPNGRRLGDDVVDIELRAIAQGYGTFLNGAFGLPNKSPNNLLGDGVDAQRRAVREHVPVRRSTAPGLRGALSGLKERAGGAAGRTAPPASGHKERSRGETDETGQRGASGAAATVVVAAPRRHLPRQLLGDHERGRRAGGCDGAVPGGLLGRAAAARQQTVSKLQAKLRANPNDVTSLDALGLAYQQRARETGDPAYYTKSEQALNRALRLAPRDLVATSGLGSLALSRHRFAEALVLGRKAHAISPTTALNYGITGDALVELGRYPAAFEAFDTMATLRPGLSSYARVSHGLELLGRVPEAIETMKLAVAGGCGPGRARGLDALPARQALLVDRPRCCRRAPGPRRPQGLSRLPLRARRALADRGGEGPQSRRDRARAAGRRPDPAAAVRGAARRPLPGQRTAARRRASSTR